ncbi:MAG: 50S ribosomal protein L25/general stress protein Ctc [Steroidobacteraceae bacterium]
MKTSFELVAEARADKQGKGASRRLRHAGRVPAILYGGHEAPANLSFDHQKLTVALQNERFFTTLLSIKIGDKTQAAILKDIQRHPAKPTVLHLDLQRVMDNEPIRMTIPLHFKNASVAPGVKTGGGQVSHLLNEVAVVCLPKDLPEYLEVDMIAMEINDTKHLSDIPLPAGVELVLLSHGRDEAVVSVHHPRVEEEAAAPAADAAPAAAAKPAAGAKPAAAPAAGAKPAAAPAKGGKK